MADCMAQHWRSVINAKEDSEIAAAAAAVAGTGAIRVDTRIVVDWGFALHIILDFFARGVRTELTVPESA